MRFLELHLQAYGPFTDAVIDLSKGEPGLHVIYGPNEAGKTSALRAIHAFLFGIHGQTADNFVHDYRDLRIGARLRGTDGDDLFLWRRKGNKDTLLDEAEEPIDESRLTRLLGGITEPVFRDAFGIDHAHLVEGGQTLLEGGGEVGESLFAAGLGSAKLRDLLSVLDRECESLFKGGSASKPTINRLLAEYRRLTKATKDASLAGQEWTAHRMALVTAEAERTRLNDLLKDEKATHSQLERLARALPKIAKRAARRTALDALAAEGPVPDLRSDFAEERRKAEQALERGNEKARRATREIEAVEEQLEALVVPESLLARTEEVETLHLELAGHLKAAKDKIGVEGKRQQHETSAEEHLAELRPGSDTKGAKPPTLSAAERARIEEVIQGHGALASAVSTATKTVSKRERAHARHAEELSALSEPPEPTRLIAAIDASRRAGDLEARMAELDDEEQEARRQAELGLERLGLWKGTLEEAETLTVPDPSTIDRFESTWAEAQGARRDVAKQAAEVGREIGRLKNELSALERGRPVPTEEDLEEARGHRQAGWQQVRRAWLDNEAIDAAAYDAERALPEAYEYAVHRADDVADDLRADADRVASKAQLLAQREVAEARQAQIEAQAQRLQAEDEAREAAWIEFWEPLGIAPLEPKEMRAWLGRHAKLLDRVEAHRKASTQRAKLGATAEKHHAHVLTELQALDPTLDPKAFESLKGLLDHAEAHADGLEQAAEDLANLRTRVEGLREEFEDARSDRSGAEAALETWQGAWIKALAPLDLDGEATPAQVRAVLQLLDARKDHLRQEASYAKRIRAIERDETEFAGKVQGIVDDVAPDLTGKDPATALRTLHRRGQAAVEASATRTRLGGDLGKWQGERETAHRDVEAAQRVLDGLCEEAGAEDIEALPLLERRAREAAALREEIEGLEDELIQEGKGTSLADLLTEAEAVDGDTLAADLDARAQTLKELEEERAAVGEQLGAARNALTSIEGTAEAANHAEEAEGVASAMRTHAEHYVRLRLARAILRREIERYRSDNQAPLLKRARDVFQRITCGSFASLESSYEEDDRPVLLGLRPNGERLPVEGMSDGTREQLYLALRLASLEQHLEAGPAVPLVVDDLLLRSDEDRSTAILKSLADLARRTQVLFFTHQRRYVELARGLDRGGEVFVAELSPRSASA